MDFDFSNIASAIPVKPAPEIQTVAADPEPETKTEPAAEPVPEMKDVQEETQEVPPSDAALKKLYDLMGAHDVTRQQIQGVVADKGYFPADTPVENYPPDFIEGVLIGAWEQVYDTILNKEIPF